VLPTGLGGPQETVFAIARGAARLGPQMVRQRPYEYTLGGIPPAPAGAEKIAITFTYDINGILAVKTKILSTGKEASLTVEKNALRLSPAERQAAGAKVQSAWDSSARAEAPSPSSAASASPAQERSALLEAVRAAGASQEVRARIEALCQKLRDAPLGSAQAEAADRALVDALLELD
jgi:molecular chaperone DnaK